jgi:transcriptional regulator with XRE-family HTH domain
MHPSRSEAPSLGALAARTIRKRLRLTQVQLADRMGVAPGAIVAWETRQEAVPLAAAEALLALDAALFAPEPDPEPPARAVRLRPAKRAVVEPRPDIPPAIRAALRAVNARAARQRAREREARIEALIQERLRRVAKPDPEPEPEAEPVVLYAAEAECSGLAFLPSGYEELDVLILEELDALRSAGAA